MLVLFVTCCGARRSKVLVPMIDAAESLKFTCQSNAGLIPKFLNSGKIKGIEFNVIFQTGVPCGKMCYVGKIPISNNKINFAAERA